MSEPGNSVERPLISPFNVIAGTIILVGLWLSFLRFTGGLGAVTNLDHNNAWGFGIAFDLLCGVALAAGGYTTAAAVEVFGMKKFHAALSPALLTGFLGYSMVVVALLYDVGRPWRLPYPVVLSPGPTSVLFEVGACVMLYLIVLFLEFSPMAAEWLGQKKLRRVLVRLTLLLTIFGITLTTMHQSSLGALFLIVPSKLHPLWYSSYLPIFFFVSSVAAGLSMVIFEGTLAHRGFADKMDEEHKRTADTVVLGFGKAAAFVLAAYFAIKVFGVALDDNWRLLGTNYGLWFLVEMIGFVALPCFLYLVGVRDLNLTVIRWASLVTVLGIILNRFNVSMVAFNYKLPAEERYFPSIFEFIVSITLVTIGVVLFATNRVGSE